MLLTGCSPFFDPYTNGFSEILAQSSCIYQSEMDPDWVRLGDRPKDFVRRLLVVRADARMTAKQALTHKWFTNKAHKRELEAVYERALRSWRPRRAVGSIVTDYSTNLEVRACHGVLRRPTIHKSMSIGCASTSNNTQQVMMTKTGISSQREPRTGAVTKSVPSLAPVSGNDNKTGIERSTGKKISHVHCIQKAQSTATSQEAGSYKGLCVVENEHPCKSNSRARRLPFSRDAWNLSAEPRPIPRAGRKLQGFGCCTDGPDETLPLQVPRHSAGHGAVTGKRKAPADVFEDEDAVFEEREDIVTGSTVKVAYADRF